jgi:acyl-CoA synthetase (AMP-forming)/AMP-acid ligase II
MGSVDTWIRRLDRAAASSGGVRFLDAREAATALSWAAVRERAGRAAGALFAAGVRPGDRVAIVLPTAPSFFDAFFGALLAGAVPAPLPALDDERLAALLRAIEATALVTERRARRSRLPWRPRLGLVAAEDLPGGHPRAPAPGGPADLALLQFSSGTTGAPRPVALTQARALAGADAVTRAVLDACPAPSVVSWLPLRHAGLLGVVLPALSYPAPLTLIPPALFRARPALWLRAIARSRAAVSAAPAFAYARCAARVRDDQLDGVDLACWRLALVGGEVVAPRTLRAFAARFARFGLRPEALTPAYGLSEAAPVVTLADPLRPAPALRLDRAALAAGRAFPLPAGDAGPDATEVASVGRPLRGFEVEVRGPDGAPGAADRVGRVYVRGPAFPAWIDTGDLGFVRAGELYVTGRARDAIVVRGRSHAPEDVERALDGVPGVRAGRAAAVGAVDEEGEHLYVFVEAREARPDLGEACRRAVRAGAGLDPRRVFVVPPGTLPCTPSGLVRRGETLRRWRAGELVRASSAGAFRRALDYVTRTRA